LLTKLKETESEYESKLKELRAVFQAKEYKLQGQIDQVTNDYKTFKSNSHAESEAQRQETTRQTSQMESKISEIGKLRIKLAGQLEAKEVEIVRQSSEFQKMQEEIEKMRSRNFFVKLDRSLASVKARIKEQQFGEKFNPRLGRKISTVSRTLKDHSQYAAETVLDTTSIFAERMKDSPSLLSLIKRKFGNMFRPSVEVFKDPPQTNAMQRSLYGAESDYRPTWNGETAYEQQYRLAERMFAEEPEPCGTSSYEYQ
jgi:hypothetical protein